MTIEPAPIVVDPSGNFLGDDGAWSTFLISAGTPPQQLQVLASTEVASTWVVAPEGCNTGDAANCSEVRGGTYDDTKSSSWNVNDIYQLQAEDNLGPTYSGNEHNGTYGYDTLSIHSKGANVSVNHQVIAAIETKTYFVGNLGLLPQLIYFGNSSDSSPSLLQSLKNENLIPSLSYGYTAGASYQQKNGVNGSLTLGGYDASRFTPNDVSFDFAPTLQRQLVVGLQSITYSDSKNQTSLLSDGVLALVDSTVPYLWLPQAACTAFENAFGITWDDLHNLYTVSDTLHDTLVKQNPSVIFQLGNSVTGDPSINITLPYASFDLEAKYSLVKSPTRYFPLQRATNDNSYTLGRTFLQESFLLVDYEHSNFSISEAVFDPSAPSHIVSLVSNTTSNNPASNPTSTNGPISKSTPTSSSKGLGTGAIAGIAIAIVLIASLVGGYFVYRNLKRRSHLKNLVEREGNEIKDVPDVDQDSKQDFSEDPEVKKPIAATITVNEVPITPPLSEADGNDFFTNNGKRLSRPHVIELPGSPGLSELSTPDPELESPDPDLIRSELSTPEPMWTRPELPSPDPSHELPSSPGVSSIASSHPSPLRDNHRSGLDSPEPRLPIQRPLSERMDSSDSEAGFTRDGMPIRPFHRRYRSDDSNAPSVQSRPSHSRMSSSDSDGFVHATRLDESSESDALSPITRPRPTYTHYSESSDSEPTILSATAMTVTSHPLRTLPPIHSNSGSDTGISSQSATSQPTTSRPGAPPRMDSSSESEAPSPSSSTTSSRHRPIRGLTTPFHSSSSYRPAIRRSIHAVTGPFHRHRPDSTGSEPWETRLVSASTENQSDVSRMPSVRQTMLESPSTEGGSDVSRLPSVR